MTKLLEAQFRVWHAIVTALVSLCVLFWSGGMAYTRMGIQLEAVERAAANANASAITNTPVDKENWIEWRRDTDKSTARFETSLSAAIKRLDRIESLLLKLLER